MIIEEVELYKVLGCKHVLLRFDNKEKSSVYIVQCNENPHARNLLTLSVQLLCSAKYAHFGSCDDPHMLEKVHRGYVRMKFIMPIVSDRHSPDAIDINIPMVSQRDENDFNEDGVKVSRQSPTTNGRELLDEYKNGETQHHSMSKPKNLMQKFVIINACRDFRSSPNEVTYSVNNGPKEICSMAAFHGRFNTCLDYMLPSLKNLALRFSGDWLELLSSDINEKWNRRAKLGDPFEKFVFLYHKYGYPKRHILSELTSANLLNIDAMETLTKAYVIKILRDTRGIFEFITACEYTVFFYIPHYGQYADVFDVKVDDLDFEYLTTHIRDNSKLTNQKYVWNEALPAVKDMLLIAFQISLSFHCKQQIIYLNNFEEISNYQAMQLATTAFFQKLGICKPAWTSKNYLQRIVDVCITCGTTAIIEFSGGTPLHPANAYLIKIYEIVEADNLWLSLKIMNDKRYAFEFFLDCLNVGLKNRNT